MSLWVHIKHSLDQATLHRDRCPEVPSTPTTADYWGQGGWFEYSNKEAALAALEQSGTSRQVNCPLCKP